MARERIGFTHEEEPRNSIADREDITSRAMDLENDLASDEALFLRTEKRVPVRRGPIAKKTAKRLRTAGILAGVAALFGSVAWGAHSYATSAARFRIPSGENIEISGVVNAPRSQVMDIARDGLGKNVFYVSLEERKEKLEQIPWVESATVMRLLPNRLSVSIVERTPVAFVQLGSKISLIDSAGVVLGMPANRQTKFSFPVIHGMADLDPRSSRAEMMKTYNHLMVELEAGSSEGEHYTRQISEVDLADPQDVKVTVNDAGGTVMVHLGKENFLDRYKLFVAHIGEWRQQHPSGVQSVDMRYEGQVIVNPDSPQTLQQQAPPPVVRPVAAVAKPAAKPAALKHRAKAKTKKRTK